MTKLITDAAELTKAIDAWTARGTKWVKDGQLLALSALQRLHDHGDIGPANRLQATMPKGTKSGSMAAYLLAFGALSANVGQDKAEKPFLFDKARADKQGGVKADMAGAMACAWETCGKAEQAPDEVFDVAKALDALLARAMKAAQVSSPETIQAVKDLRAGLKASPVAPASPVPTE